MKLTEKEQIQESISELRDIARVLSEISLENYYQAQYEGDDILRVVNRLTSILEETEEI
jgi:hypothetical protein